jgi:hypothetical protein
LFLLATDLYRIISNLTSIDHTTNTTAPTTSSKHLDRRGIEQSEMHATFS